MEDGHLKGDVLFHEFISCTTMHRVSAVNPWTKQTRLMIDLAFVPAPPPRKQAPIFPGGPGVVPIPELVAFSPSRWRGNVFNIIWFISRP